MNKNKLDKKQVKNAIKLLKNHKEDVDKMLDICTEYKIPYLDAAYRNVVAVVEQLIRDMEFQYKNMEK